MLLLCSCSDKQNFSCSVLFYVLGPKFFSCSVLFYALGQIFFRALFCSMFWGSFFAFCYELLQSPGLETKISYFWVRIVRQCPPDTEQQVFDVRLFWVFGSNSSRVTRKIYGLGWKYKVLGLKYTVLKCWKYTIFWRQIYDPKESYMNLLWERMRGKYTVLRLKTHGH